MRASRRRSGFTLIEVVTAIAIIAGMGITISMAFTTGLNAKEKIEADGEKYRMLRSAMERMCREIAAAYVSDRYDSRRYRDAMDRPTNFIGESDRLVFSSLANQRLYQDAKESDQMIVEYSIQTSREKGVGSRDDLIRRVNTVLDGKLERGGTEDVLYEGIRKIEFEYWDTARQEWDDEWDTRRSERKSILPSRVRITLHAKDETGEEVKYTTQTRIMLNTELPRYQ